MPQFSAFRGVRYDLGHVSLDDVIAPPYDVVSPDARARLAAKSEYNAIHVELPEPDAASGLDPYQHAASLFETWAADGVLARDALPAFYAYRMTRRRGGAAVSSTLGVIGAMEVGSDSVLPHEQTMPKDTRDRLDLLRACRANMSPIWGLSLSAGLSAACSKAIDAVSDQRAAVDEDGTEHELWAITDQSAIDEIASLVAATPVVIADGHHRYETAGQFRRECRAANGDQPGDYDSIMTMIVELSKDELAVDPIHRLVGGLPEGFDIAAELSRTFELVPGPDDPEELFAQARSAGALALVTNGKSVLLVPRPGGPPRPELDSAYVDELLKTWPAHDLSYRAGASEVIAAVRSGTAQATILVKPATVDQIANTAHSGVRMPPKTTYFAPKLRTGMVFRVLDI